jgi:3-hydroxyacyl-[acyl-carrier-protein] dehydratase
MSLKSLYELSDLRYFEGEFSGSLRFNPDHEIFEGHFPGQPVVPGVVLIYILKDLCSKIVGSNAKLVKGTNIKFLNIIDPTQNVVYLISGTYSVKEDETISLSAGIRNEESINIKFKGTFAI